MVVGLAAAITWAAGASGSAGSDDGARAGRASAGAVASGAPRPAAPRAAAPTLVTADLTPDGLDRYDYALRTPSPGETRSAVDEPVEAGDLRADPAAGGDADVVVSAPVTNQGVSLRSLGWFDQGTLAVDAESCATWTEFTGPIAQAGVALRVRSAPGGAQAITVTNNIMWGARNGWNVHLWSGAEGDLIGQIVLNHAFGLTVFQTPPLPWRVCARVVGPTLQFKAWSLALGPGEPDWTDPGYGASFALPREWVYAGRAGWYVGHLVGGDQIAYRSLTAHGLEVSVSERAAVTAQTSAQEVVRAVAASLERVAGTS